MKHLTKYTRSFIFILIISLGSAYGALILAKYQKTNIPTYGTDIFKKAKSRSAPKPTATQQPLLSTTGWKKFENAKFPLTFEYPARWTITAKTPTDDYNTITAISPAKEKLTIYIGEKGYYAMNGLNTKPLTIDGSEGMAWNDAIAAVKVGKYYYTFDASQNSKPVTEFKTILSTVQIDD